MIEYLILYKHFSQDRDSGPRYAVCHWPATTWSAIGQ